MAHLCRTCRRRSQCIIARGLENLTARESVESLAFRAYDSQGYPGDIEIRMGIERCKAYNPTPGAGLSSGAGILVFEGSLRPDVPEDEEEEPDGL